MSDNPAGWQPDPTGKHDHRYWDGTQWTDNVADAGVAGTDAYEPPPAAADGPPPVSSDAPTAVTVVPGDDTASFPAPPPYVPPTPTSDGSTPSGSKRGLVIGGAILGAVVIAVIAFLALGGDDDSDVRAQLASAIAADTDMTNAQAECIADLVVDEVGEDAFEDTDFDADDPPPELIAAFGSIGAETFVDECGIDEEALGGSGGSTDSTDEETDGDDEQSLEDLEDACADGDFAACDDLYFSADLGSDLEEFGSTCGGIAEPQSGSCESTDGGEGSSTDGSTPGNMTDILTDAYQDMGLSEEQAECLTDRIIEAMDSGELDEEQAMSEVFSYLADCDIDLEDLDGT